MIPRSVAFLLFGGTMVLGSSVASSQDYPNKVIRILTSTPGSTNDVVARVIAQGLTGRLRQPAIVENRAGQPRGQTRFSTFRKAESDPQGRFLDVWRAQNGDRFLVQPGR